MRVRSEHRRPLQWGVLAVVAGLACCRPPAPYEPEPYIPASADVALVTPPLGEARPAVVAFLEGAEGAEGLLDLVRERYGVDLRDPEGLRLAGLDPRARLVAFREGGIWVLGVGLSDRAAFAERLNAKLLNLGLVAADPAFPEGSVVAIAPGPENEANGTATRVACKLTNNAAWLALRLDTAAPPAAAASVAAPTAAAAPPVPPAGTADPGRVLANLAPARETLMKNALFNQAMAGAGPQALRLYADLRPWLAGPEAGALLASWLGAGAGFVRPSLEAFGAFGATVDVGGQGLRVRARWLRHGDSPPPPLFAWLAPAGQPVDFGRLLPTGTPLFVRGSLNMQQYANIPPFLRRLAFQSNPLGFVHPAAQAADLDADVLQHLTGRFAFAVLGLDSRASLAGLSRAFASRKALFENLHLALLLEIKDPAALAGRWSTLLQASLGKVEPVADAAVPALRVPSRDVPNLGLALADHTLIVTVGDGEQDRVLRALGDRSPNLHTRARGELAQSVVGTGATPLGFFITFDRLLRQLQAKGFPPHFLKVLGSPDALSGALGLDDEGIRIDLEVSL